MGLYINGKNVIPMRLLGQISANSVSAVDTVNFVQTSSDWIYSRVIQLSTHLGGLSSLEREMDDKRQFFQDQIEYVDGQITNLSNRLSNVMQDIISINLSVDTEIEELQASIGNLDQVSSFQESTISSDILRSDNVFTGVNKFRSEKVDSIYAKQTRQSVQTDDVIFIQHSSDQKLYQVSFQQLLQQLKEDIDVQVQTYSVTFNPNWPTYNGNQLDFSTYNNTVHAASVLTSGQELGSLSSVGQYYRQAYQYDVISGYEIIPRDNANLSYKFLGWYKEDNTPITNTTQVTSDMTCIAKWERKNLVRFNRQYGADGSTRYILTCFIERGLPVGTGFTYGELPSTLTNQKGDGYTFTGWYTAQDPTDGRTWNKGSTTWPRDSDGIRRYKVYVNKTLYPDLPTFISVEYTPQSSLENQVTSDVDTTSPYSVITLGNIASVWNYNPDTSTNGMGWCGGVPVLSSFVPSGPLILYAHWEKNPLTS